MKHKHAEILHAIADGVPVQFSVIPKQVNGIKFWIDYDAEVHYSPLHDHHLEREWRIKPAEVPQPDISKYFVARIWHGDNVHCDSHNLKLTFDANGNLKDAEVLKNG
jgi:hypothetical protein